MCSSHAEKIWGYRHHVHVGGCAFRIFFFLKKISLLLLFFSTVSLSLCWLTPQAQVLSMHFLNDKHFMLKHQLSCLIPMGGGLVHFRGEENSFASHLHCISIWACISTHSQSSASFVTTCSSTLMFIHPSASETYNQKTDLCTISTFKQVETGNKTLVRQKQVRDWNRDYGETQDKSWTKQVK